MKHGSAPFESIARTAMVAAGVGCILFVLLLSRSGQISRSYPLSLSDFSVYAITLGVAAVLIVAVALARGEAASHMLYRALAWVANALVVAWAIMAVLVGVTETASASAYAAQPLFLAFEVVRLVFTALLGILWNLHMSLNKVSETPQIVALSVIVAAVLYVCSLACADGGMALAVCAALVSCALLAFVSKMFTFRDGAPCSLQSAQRVSAQEPQPEVSVAKVRATFFLSRILWNVVMVMSLYISYEGFALLVPNAPHVAFVAMAFVLVGAAFVLLRGGKASACFIAVALPLFVVSFCTLGLGVDSVEAMAPMLSIVTLLVWYTVFYVQLPSYRSIVRMDAIPYAFLERLIPIAAIYFVSMLIPSGLSDAWQAAFAGGQTLSVLVALLAAASSVLAVVVLVRHIVQYYPDVPDFSMHMESAPAEVEEPSESPVQVAVSHMAAEGGLTPRETDVLYYLARGYSKPYVAKALCVSLATVKTHTGGIYRKLGVASHDELLDLLDKELS